MKCIVMMIYSCRGLEASCFEVKPEDFQGSLDEFAEERYSLWLEKNLDGLEAFADTLTMEYSLGECFETL